MPTGYTANIADGISFEKFVMRCARGMGALVMMRDEPFGAPISERFEPSDYHVRKLADMEAKRKLLGGMTAEKTETAARLAYEEELAYHAKILQKKRDLRAAYQGMLDKVNDWTPPTSEHIGLKKFMVDQLVRSVEFDCDEKYYLKNKPTQKTGEEWFASELEEVTRSIQYHRKEYVEEVSRTEARNNWIASLRRSLERGEE